MSVFLDIRVSFPAQAIERNSMHAGGSGHGLNCTSSADHIAPPTSLIYWTFLMILHLRVVDSTHLVVSTHNPPLSHGIGTNVIMIFDLNMVVKKNESISRIGQYWPLTFGRTTQPMTNRRGATACVEVLHFPYSFIIFLIVGDPAMQQRPFVRVCGWTYTKFAAGV